MENIENLPVVRKARKAYHDKLRMLQDAQRQIRRHVAEYSGKYLLELQKQISHAKLEYIKVIETEKAKRIAHKRPVHGKKCEPTVMPAKAMSKSQAKEFLKNKRGTRVCKDQCCVCGQYFPTGWMYHDADGHLLIICNNCKSRCMNGKMNFSRQAIDCNF